MFCRWPQWAELELSPQACAEGINRLAANVLGCSVSISGAMPSQEVLSAPVGHANVMQTSIASTNIAGRSRHHSSNADQHVACSLYAGNSAGAEPSQGFILPDWLSAFGASLGKTSRGGPWHLPCSSHDGQTSFRRSFLSRASARMRSRPEGIQVGYIRSFILIYGGSDCSQVRERPH